MFYTIYMYTYSNVCYYNICCNFRLALQNTRLLQTYSLFDQRVKPLIYAVRYWAKLKGLAGNPKAGNQLSNYALTWMVLYYLMNTKPSLVPTVEYLANLCGKHLIIILFQWLLPVFSIISYSYVTILQYIYIYIHEIILTWSVS